MHILIAGGAGFIGSHLCEVALSEGHQVTAVDNLITGRKENVAAFEGHDQFALIEQDICEPVVIEGELDAILNFASPASPVDYLNHPIETLRTGAIGTERLLELAQAKQARFLLASTSEVYGDPLEHPQKEAYWGNVHSIGIRSCYDEAKRYAEAVTMAYHRAHGIDTKIIRIFNTYGPRMAAGDGRVVPNFIVQALQGKPLTVYGEGKQTRSLCYVSDLVDGIYKVLASEEHWPVNLGNPDEMTILEMAEKIASLAGAQSELTFKPLPEDDPQRRCPDISKAKSLLGWEPQVSSDEGLAKTIAWFKEHPEVVG